MKRSFCENKNKCFIKNSSKSILKHPKSPNKPRTLKMYTKDKVPGLILRTLKQATRIANDSLQNYLSKHRYFPYKIATNIIWSCKEKITKFSLICR